MPVPIKKSSSAPASLTPEQKIKALEVQLREANEKAQLFQAVLDVLKKDYGVRVVKKPSGKSSRKSSSRG
jgi:transposase